MNNKAIPIEAPGRSDWTGLEYCLDYRWNHAAELLGRELFLPNPAAAESAPTS